MTPPEPGPANPTTTRHMEAIMLQDTQQTAYRTECRNAYPDTAGASGARKDTASDIDTFKSIIERYIKPLIYGADLRGPVENGGKRRDAVAFDTIHRLVIAVPERRDLSFILERPLPFTEEEKKLVETVMHRVHKDAIHTSGAFHLLACNAVEEALALHVSPEYPETVYKVLQLYNQWAAETHEGKKLVHTIGICPVKNHKKSPSIFALKETSAIKKLAADEGCMLTVAGDGSLLGMENTATKNNALRKNHSILAPVSMTDIALWTNTGGKIAIRLTAGGEILIFKNKTLVFARRRSLWRCLPHKRMLEELITANDNTEEREAQLATYLTMLDLAFSRTGACLGVLKYAPETAPALVSPDVLFASASMTPTVAMLKTVINGRKFQELPRKLRKQLCALDGAVLLDASGTILTAGAIVKTDGNPDGGGGRSAAARILGPKGAGVKVSSDGFIEIYLGNQPLPGFA